MAGIADWLEVCNMALLKLGETPIKSLSEGTEKAILCNFIYEKSRDFILALHEWRSAIFRQSLAQLTEAPAFGYAYQYQLPAEPYCIRVLNIVNSLDYPYNIEGNRLLCDLESVEIRYIKQISDSREADALLKEVISLKIAVDLCYKITKSLPKKRMLKNMLTMALQRAKGVNLSRAKQPDPETNNSWLEAGRG